MNDMGVASPPGVIDGRDADCATVAAGVTPTTGFDVATPTCAGDGRSLDVRPDDPWAEAGRKVLCLHLGRMLGHVPGVVDGEDAEDVHAMRVAARRMRAAWRVFGDGFERRAVRRYRAELRDIGAGLGTVRDLDVLIGILVAYAERAGQRQRAGLQPLLASWRAERDVRRTDLITMLASRGTQAFIEDYRRLVEAPGMATAPVAAHEPGLVRNRMPSTAWGAYQEVWAFDRDLRSADLATLHRLRVAAKWLRYTLEFASGPMEPHATPLIRSVVALQDHLGDQHDQHVAAVLARAYLADASPTGAELDAVEGFVGALDRRVERLHRTLDRAWQPIEAASYRRGLGRAIARL